jgi:tetratricopeptide (TPR) repeat protein
MFERALHLDPEYGPALAGMAYLLNRDLLLDNTEDFEATASNCLEFARKAVEFDEAASVSRVELIRALLWTGQYDAAIQQAEEAVKLNPSNALAHAWLGAALVFSGREEEGIPRLEHALELAPRDPRNTFFMTHLALAHLTTGHAERGCEWARIAAQRASDFIEASAALASILSHLDRVPEACMVLSQAHIRHLNTVRRRPFWRRYKHSATLDCVLIGLQKAGLQD